MTVPSPHFFLFAASMALLFHLGRPLWWRRTVLLAANGIFLAGFAADPRAFIPLAAFVMLGYVSQRFCARRWRVLPMLLLAIICIFAWLKRYSFVPHAAVLPFPYVTLGLSYIFFRVLHLTIDRYQDPASEPVGVVSYLNYTLNFTTLISGPIQRYADFKTTESRPLPLDLAIVGRALERIVIGTFKVEIVSAALFVWQHQAIASLHAGGDMWTRALSGVEVTGLYPLYLYFNFSGYIDVVIGTALLFGAVPPENFDRPFLAENVLSFWTRWHMTLSGWLKTYVFNPLMLASMSRVTAPSLAPYVSAGAFFVTFFLVGLWHGQTTSFLVFGLLTGGGVATNKLWQVAMQRALGRVGYRALATHSIYRACSRGLNFTWFAFTLLWFWSSWPDILSSFHDLGSAAAATTLAGVFAAATLSLSALEIGSVAILSPDKGLAVILRSRYVRTATSTALAVMVAANLALLETSPPDIVYKAF